MSDRTITTLEQLEALPDGAVILDKHDDVSQKRSGYWCGYETATLTNKQISKYLPARLIWEPTK